MSAARAGRRVGRADRVEGRITREDIESQLRSILGEAEEAVDDVRGRAVPTAAVAALVLLLLAYLLGRRSGRRRAAVVEIRRL
jgi:hypothetical protein